MKRSTVWLLLAAVGLAIVSAGPSFAREPRKARLMGVRGGKVGKIGKIVPRLAAPIVRPIILNQAVPPFRLRPVAVAAVKPYQGPEVGLAAGLFANIPSAAGEIRFHKVLGLDGTAVKAGLRFAEGKDANEVTRKNALIFADGIFNLNKGPARSFIWAGGSNYLAYTTGQTNGTVGGEVYLGVQEGSFYAEAGYAAIRTGFSPSYKGIDLNLGFKWVY